MKPIMQKPMAVAMAIFWNSVKQNIENDYTNTDERGKKSLLPFLSGLVHLFTSLTESLENWRPGSNTFVT